MHKNKQKKSLNDIQTFNPFNMFEKNDIENVFVASHFWEALKVFHQLKKNKNSK